MDRVKGVMRSTTRSAVECCIDGCPNGATVEGPGKNSNMVSLFRAGWTGGRSCDDEYYLMTCPACSREAREG